MKKLKFILPGVASVFAIAVSFASVNFIENPSNDYIDDGTSCKEIEEVPCNNVGNTLCRAFSASLGSTHVVNDARSGTQCVSPKFDNTGTIFPIN